MQGPTLTLKTGTFAQLLTPAGVAELDRSFLAELAQAQPTLFEQLQRYRRQPAALSAAQTSEFLLSLAPLLERFIAQLFSIQDAVDDLRAETLSHDCVLLFKKQFVQRRARRYRGQLDHSAAHLDQWLSQQLQDARFQAPSKEYSTALFAQHLLQAPELNKPSIEMLTQWCIHQTREPSEVSGWISFQLPQSLDPTGLVPLQETTLTGIDTLQSDPHEFQPRDGFRLTDSRMQPLAIQNEAHYCVYCHQQEGDFCAKGFPVKKGQPELGFKVNPLGVTLTGCPLEEKISEMNLLKRQGASISALAMAMVDNPMVPATGHRICNDCMKACIYQKQDPVNIPEIETAVLTDVLELPWGIEIYDLLTRWNPLRARQFLSQPFNGHRVLIVGMGPAGFTMAHHLTMEGCAVTGIDGLKIEPLPNELLEQPIYSWSSMLEQLDERIIYGFGGVAEYGITVRWEKNFLKLIYLSLARRQHFQVYGGVRFGGTITLEDAAELGFDHVCIATGTGLPNILEIPNSMARGMRQASDFLMALQLTGAGKKSSLAGLQIRLPALVIGGGLTAIDTATEIQALYIQQVEKITEQVGALTEHTSLEVFLQGLSAQDQAQLKEHLAHGDQVLQERRLALKEGRAANFIPLLHSWGGVSIVYRKGLNQSPAYLRNHEEVIKAMQEGLFYAQGLAPLRVEVDEFNNVAALVCQTMRAEDGSWLNTGNEVTMPARTILVATGAKPNIIYAQEHPGAVALDIDHFKPHVYHELALQPTHVAAHCKASAFGAFTSYENEHRYVTFIGDTNPVFHGSVVKAIASAARIYPQVMTALKQREFARLAAVDYAAFTARMQHLLQPVVTEVNALHASLVEIWVRAPQAARNFKPGQFFRLQTFEQYSSLIKDTRLQIPLMTVSGTGIRGDEIRLLVLQWGSLPKLAAKLTPGTPIILMGPNGAPTEIPNNKTIMIVAGRWGAAVLRDIGPALRQAGNNVIYVATFNSADEIDNQDELEAAADQIIWCSKHAPEIQARRPQDSTVISADPIAVIKDYQDQRDTARAAQGISTTDVDTLMIMGSTGLLSGFQQAIKSQLSNYFPAHLNAVGTVGSPMQCMLKGVCAQCLQWQIDPDTGERTRAVFSCAQQDQPLLWIDVENLSARQSQNTIVDYVMGRWLGEIMTQLPNVE